MRFSSLIAFMLPLSTLAAPLVQRGSANSTNVDNLRDQILVGLETLEQELSTLNKTSEVLQQFSQNGVVNDIANIVKGAQQNFVAVASAAQNIADAVLANQAPQEKDQADFSVNILQMQFDLGELQVNLGDAIKPNPKDGNKLQQQIKVFIDDLNSAKAASDNVVAIGCGILALQGTDLQDLLAKFELVGPPGASCPQ